MKKTVFLCIAAIGIAAMSFRLAIDKTAATVEQIDGIQIFSYSKPTAKYDIIGNVQLPKIVTSFGDERIVMLVKRAKENNPSAEAIIINSVFYKAEVIRFKE